MKDNKSFGKYLLYFICSASVVGAATFYFHASDTKKNTTTVIIEPYTDETITASTETFEQTVTQKTTKAHKTTTTKTAATRPAETTSEFVFIDINSAGAEDFSKLKGIGTVLADEIISYRENNGSFRNIEEIMNVNGIGEAIFADIREHIYVIEPIYDVEDDNFNEEPAENEAEIPATEYIITLEEAAPIDINCADIETLMLLPHIDEDTAQRIIDFREQNGGFKNTYELLLIEGISRNEANEILEFVTIG
ncbi:ComEA family DNA-binding protein [Ruminococcus flavefaciens]|uniref:ComEA family DNA-binding protein n=1 Tax=Ruminococcus flavefaciens TaxID=1265 RepID=UPI000490D86E|nr:helix-hairpin-helix domain-containing protein [Ruminococcus flavefaciens]